MGTGLSFAQREKYVVCILLLFDAYLDMAVVIFCRITVSYAFLAQAFVFMFPSIFLHQLNLLDLPQAFPPHSLGFLIHSLCLSSLTSFRYMLSYLLLNTTLFPAPRDPFLLISPKPSKSFSQRYTPPPTSYSTPRPQ